MASTSTPKNNQEFVQIPTARLKARIGQLCEQYGLRFVETEESYTSQASFLDDDFLPTYGEKPATWKASGKRGKKGDGLGRGQYQTASKVRINSDCNGAANILKKIAAQLDLNLAEVGRAVLTLPKRYRLDSLSRSYREKSEEARLQPDS
jgi:transposase